MANIDPIELLKIKENRMTGFDIESLLEFDPAKRWCYNCHALWGIGYSKYLTFVGGTIATCKVCGFRYIGTKDYPIHRLDEFICQLTGMPLQRVENIVDHAQRLASISRIMRTAPERYPPLRALFMALAEARSFVHFISWGITQLMIGVLKMASQHVMIRGVVSGNVREEILCEVNDFQEEAPYLDIKFCESTGFRCIDVPHQKLVVIDGLLAFKGSANLTQTAWRGAAKGKEILEVVSNVDEVINLHNQFFSPIYGKMGSFNELILGED